jgi:Xaa-Pro aminopeptidase
MKRGLCLLGMLLISVAALAAAPDPKVIRQRRVDVLLPQAMAAHNVDAWLVISREYSRDPLAADLGGGGLVARGALIFARTASGFRKIAIVASYDTTPIEESRIYDQVIAYRGEGIKPHLKKVLEELNPKRIGVNISRDVPIGDGLTVGMRNYLEETLGREWAARLISAEPLVVSFRGRRLPEEVALLREAAAYTDKIIREALTEDVAKPGKTTENDVADYLRRRAAEFGATVPFVSVEVGPTRGHAEPTDRVIQPGDLVRIDFGITHKGYSTDVQRTAYVLRPGETAPPAEIQKMWETCRAATDAAIAAMRPGVTGNHIDTVARKVVTNAGYEGYPHAAGHPIGFDVHDVGPLLGPAWPERYGSTVFFKLEEGQSFAVEPIVYADYAPMGGEVHIGLEEDVVVTAEGAAWLHGRQKDLILLRAAAK